MVHAERVGGVEREHVHVVLARHRVAEVDALALVHVEDHVVAVGEDVAAEDVAHIGGVGEGLGRRVEDLH